MLTFFLHIVCFHVSLEFVFWDETFFTDVAGAGLVTTVRKHVFLQLARLTVPVTWKRIKLDEIDGSDRCLTASDRRGAFYLCFLFYLNICARTDQYKVWLWGMLVCVWLVSVRQAGGRGKSLWVGPGGSMGQMTDARSLLTAQFTLKWLLPRVNEDVRLQVTNCTKCLHRKIE